MLTLTDRTYAELDLLFERGVPARKFASTHVDAYDVPSDAYVASGTDPEKTADVHTVNTYDKQVEFA